MSCTEPKSWQEKFEESERVRLELVQQLDKVSQDSKHHIAENKLLISEIDNLKHDYLQFTSIVSHDFSAPLRHINNGADLLESSLEHPLSEDTIEFLDIIKTAGNRLNNLVDGLLRYSRTQSHEPVLVQLDLNQVVEDILSAFEETVTQNDIKIDVEHLPCIYADVSDIKRLLYILIDNAIKYRVSKAAGHRVEITYQWLDKECKKSGEALCLSIKDNGIGFDNKNVDDIFKPLKRLVPIEKYEGSGVGLAIAKKIVGRYSGSITAHAVKGQGATFNIILSTITEK